jgi:hypothetical protein
VAELGVLDAKAVANDADGRTRRDALDQSAGSLCGAVTTEGIQHFACELIKPMQQEGIDNASARKWGVRLLEHFFANNKTCDYSDQVRLCACALLVLVCCSCVFLCACAHNLLTLSFFLNYSFAKFLSLLVLFSLFNLYYPSVTRCPCSSRSWSSCLWTATEQCSTPCATAWLRS